MIDGRDVTDEAPAKRELAMVFQSYALYPHMTVRKNIAFPLKMAGEDKATIDKKVAEAAARPQPHQLSRPPAAASSPAASASASPSAAPSCASPTAFLFDEPLSNLDAALRGTMRLEITELHQQLGTTMVYVTHDQVEAMTMADKIVVLNAGNIEQVGSPLELYRSPRNLLRRRLHRLAEDELRRGRRGRPSTAPQTIGIRPEHIGVSTTRRGDWKGTVGVAEHLGADTFLHVHAEGDGTEQRARRRRGRRQATATPST